MFLTILESLIDVQFDAFYFLIINGEKLQFTGGLQLQLYYFRLKVNYSKLMIVAIIFEFDQIY